MYKAYSKAGSLAIHGVLFLILGIFIIVTNNYFLQTVTFFSGTVFLIMGVLDAFRLLLKNNDKIEKNRLITTLITNFVLAFLLLVTEKLVYGFFPILFGCMGLLYAAVDLITYFIYRKNESSGRTAKFFGFLINLFFGITMCVQPVGNVGAASVYIGIWCILYGINYLQDFLKAILPTPTKDKMKKKVRISLPVFLVALIPRQMLDRINKHFEVERKGVYSLTEQKSTEKPDLFVYVHVSKDGYGPMGHVDIGYKGKTYSYGNYDEDSRRLFEALGDGVLIVAPQEKYLPFVLQYSKKTIFEFGVKLTEEQIVQLEDSLKDLRGNVYPWDSKEQEYNKEHPEDKHEFDDYASVVTHETGGQCYKFFTGKFKTYFVLSTNCVLLADHLIGHLGLDLVEMNGIISPGAYYDYFNRQFLIENSSVISKKTYNYQSELEHDEE